MHWPSNRNVDGVQVARGGDVNEVTWKLMGIQGRELYDQEKIEEKLSLKSDLERKEFKQSRKRNQLQVYPILLVLVSNTANSW